MYPASCSSYACSSVTVFSNLWISRAVRRYLNNGDNIHVKKCSSARSGNLPEDDTSDLVGVYLSGKGLVGAFSVKGHVSAPNHAQFGISIANCLFCL